MSTLKYQFYLSYIWDYLALMDYEYLLKLAQADQATGPWPLEVLKSTIVESAKITQTMVDFGSNQVSLGEMTYFVDNHQ